MGSFILQALIEASLFYLIRNIIGNGIQQLNGVLVDVGIVDSNISADSSSNGTAKRLSVFLAVR